MTRYKLTLEYDGSDFVGWQRQDNGLGVQQILEDAVRGFCGETVNAYAAGRTDAGVHALGQVAHVDIEKETAADTVRDALNFHMKPRPVVILHAEAVGEDFHARFSARERAYLYRIVNRRSPLALDHKRAWWVPVALDHDAMHEAAQVLVGHHDFTSFRATQCQAQSPVKTLDALDVSRAGEEIVIAVRARSFLHHQVRNMVGTLRLVGEGKWTVRDVKNALDARERASAGPTAPAEGLYLREVLY
ncbi:MAG: tRNA pseudouridine(38-40) synthase TruA [Rhodospirillales bacterium]